MKLNTQTLSRLDIFFNLFVLSALGVLMVLSVVASTLLLLGALSLGVTIGITLLLSIPVIILISKNFFRHKEIIAPVNLQKERVLCFIALFAVLASWGVLNAKFTSEHIFVNRDPGIYTLGALHLSENDNFDISSKNIFGEFATVESLAVGVSEVDQDKLYFQGLHLLPALVGLGGKIVGTDQVYHLNVVFGVSAILAVFAFALRLVRPFWALTAATLFSITMPLIYFSRDMYTEPLAATLTFSGLTFLWLAVQTRSYWLWALSGIAVGAATLTRIDGYIAIAATLFFIAFYLAFSNKKERRKTISEAGAFIGGATVTGILGWLDLLLLSSGYFFDLYKNFLLELAAIAIALIGIAVLCWLSWRTSIIKKFDLTYRKYYAGAIVAITSLAVIVLGTRQFWDETYNNRGRNYNELAPLWPGWYLGDLIVALAIIGIVIALYLTIVRRKIIYLIPLAVIVLTSALYLVRPSISPDHIWASRRLLPVIMPGFIVFAMLAVETGFNYLFKSFYKSKVFEYMLMAAIALVLAIAPLTVSKPLLLKRQYNQLSILTSFCEKLPQDAAVIWLGTAKNWALQSTEKVCDIPSAGFSSENVNKEKLATASRSLTSKGYVPVVAIFGSDYEPSPALLASKQYTSPLENVSKNTFKRISGGAFGSLENPVNRAPSVSTNPVLEIYAAGLNDGELILLDTVTSGENAR